MHGLGYHPAQWRHAETPAGGNMDVRHYVHMARTAERGLFDMVFLADTVGLHDYDEPPGALARMSTSVQFEPITLLSSLAMVTSRVGLVASASTTYNEPYHIARKIASLDHLSGGRAGWNVVTSHTDMEAQNFGLDENPNYVDRYGRAEEFVEVVRGLWDTWEEGAFLLDKAKGINFDASKQHVLDHRGKHFSVRGPLTVAPTPQGHPVIVQAGASEQGRSLAAATANVVYTAARSLKQAQEFYASVKGRMAKYGRDPDDLKIMPGLLAVVGRTEQEAKDKYEALQQLVDPALGLACIAQSMGDFTGYPIDGPVPKFPKWRLQSRGDILYELALRNNLTIRQLYFEIAAGNGHNQVIGTPSQVVDFMQEWLENDGADGFNVLPLHQPTSLEDFVDLVVPEMQRRGLFRTRYEGSTLREHLGVARPVNRYTRAKSEAAFSK
jgi:alkanesulfonate monooxygenase